jgi:arylsulfatase A-like enzyme
MKNLPNWKNKLVGLALMLSAACANADDQPDRPVPDQRPNVLFILTDDQTYNGVAALGNPEIKTPNLDTLARHGTSFANTRLFGANNGAVCAPSRAMLMTGRTFYDLPQSVVIAWSGPKEKRGDCPYDTFPEVFRKAGYETFGTGKQHNGTKIFTRGFSAGGMIFFGGMHPMRKGGHLKPVVNDFDPSGAYTAPYVGGKFSTELFTDAAVGFLKQHDASKAPFMMYVAYSAPHDPRMAPQKYKDMYPPEKITLPENFLPEHPFDNGALRIRDENLAPHPRTPERTREEIAGYYAMITHVDAEVGRIFKVLEERGMAGNTIIVMAGDNGLACGQHGLLGKQNLYEHSIGVPLIIAGKGLPVGRVIQAPCYLHDVYPTLCELAGLEIPESVTSKSLVPLLEGKARSLRDAHFHAFTKTQRAVRVGDWKLIRYNVKGKQTTQLFNLARDPMEMNNLAERAEHKNKVAELSARLAELGRAEGDTEDWYR